MKKIILTSHGTLAEGLKSMSEMVLGDLSIETLSFVDEMGIETFKKNVETLLKTINFAEDQLVIACDLKNGTPYNVFLQNVISNNFQDKVKLFYGMNFPMVITLVEWQEGNVTDADLKNCVYETQKEQVGMFEYSSTTNQDAEF